MRSMKPIIFNDMTQMILCGSHMYDVSIYVFGVYFSIYIIDNRLMWKEIISAIIFCAHFSSLLYWFDLLVLCSFWFSILVVLYHL